MNIMCVCSHLLYWSIFTWLSCNLVNVLSPFAVEQWKNIAGISLSLQHNAWKSAEKYDAYVEGVYSFNERWEKFQREVNCS